MRRLDPCEPRRPRELPDALAARSEAVRAVFGHFFFVNLPAHCDDDGRMGRFSMNAMLASGGYPWTVVPLARRARHLNALEAASVGRDIGPCAQLLAELVGRG